MITLQETAVFEMAICYVYVSLPTVLLMYFNNLASCFVPNKNKLKWGIEQLANLLNNIKVN